MRMNNTANSDGRIRLGIIGAGAIGRVHASVFEQVEGVDMAGLFDISPSLATELAEDHNIAKVYDSVDALRKFNDMLRRARSAQFMPPKPAGFGAAAFPDGVVGLRAKPNPAAAPWRISAFTCWM